MLTISRIAQITRIFEGDGPEKAPQVNVAQRPAADNFVKNPLSIYLKEWQIHNGADPASNYDPANNTVLLRATDATDPLIYIRLNKDIYGKTVEFEYEWTPQDLEIKAEVQFMTEWTKVVRSFQLKPGKNSLSFVADLRGDTVAFVLPTRRTKNGNETGSGVLTVKNINVIDPITIYNTFSHHEIIRYAAPLYEKKDFVLKCNTSFSDEQYSFYSNIWRNDVTAEITESGNDHILNIKSEGLFWLNRYTFALNLEKGTLTDETVSDIGPITGSSSKQEVYDFLSRIERAWSMTSGANYSELLSGYRDFLRNTILGLKPLLGDFTWKNGILLESNDLFYKGIEPVIFRPVLETRNIDFWWITDPISRGPLVHYTSVKDVFINGMPGVEVVERTVKESNDGIEAAFSNPYYEAKHIYSTAETWFKGYLYQMNEETAEASVDRKWTQPFERAFGFLFNSTCSWPDGLDIEKLSANYLYFLRAFNGTATDIQQELEFSFRLSQNYPNPFNPSTTISFSLPKAGDATIVITDALGREVKTFELANLRPGTSSVTWDASGKQSGLYTYTLKAGDQQITKRMVLMK